MARRQIERVEPQFLEELEPEFGRSRGQIDDERADSDVANDEATLASLGATLYAKFIDVERKRIDVEERWLEDLRQFHGHYDPNTDNTLRESDSCLLFLNITKPKTHAFAARIMDMVLPTDGENWDLEPTPVPEIAGMGAGLSDAPAMSDALMGKPGSMDPGETPDGSDPALPGANSSPAAPSAQPGQPAAPAQPPGPPSPGQPQGMAPAPGQAPGASPDMQPGMPAPASTEQMMTPQGAPVLKKDIVQAVKDEAKQRCEAMRDEVADQLAETRYNSVQRQAIEQMAKLGAGIIMGPVVLDEWRVTWVAQPNAETGKSDYVRKLVPNDSKRPGVQWIDCWNFYPDMSTSNVDEMEFAFVQYLVNASTFKKMAKRFNFLEEPVRVALRGTPFNARTLRWMSELRLLSETNNTLDTRYRLLRYYGELNADDLRAVGMDPEEMGVTDTVRGVVWLVDEVVLKVDLNPLDSGEMPFSMCYTDKDEASPFGRGIPRLMRGEQESVNASWRMKHDNAGLSVCPQTVMRMNSVTPADGDYHMKPKKLWYVADDVPNVNNVFAHFSIDSHQAELDNLLQMAIRFADDVTQLPLLMQGDQAPHITQTAQGMSLLYNASTVVLRRCVKFYDDGVSEPLIGRFYDWNMQFNDRDDIKGDFRAVARGSSTLLDKEQQGQALDAAMQIAMQPTWQPYTDMKKLYKEAMKSKRIPDILLSDDQIEKNLAQQAKLAEMQAQSGQKGAPPPDPLGEQKLAVAQAAVDAKNRETDTRLQIAQMQLKHESDVKEPAKIAGIKIKEDANNQRFNKEIDTKVRMGTGI